ncbi:hypothetical protein THAOC_00966, partial [Thalassiosira oceanica]
QSLYLKIKSSLRRKRGPALSEQNKQREARPLGQAGTKRGTAGMGRRAIMVLGKKHAVAATLVFAMTIKSSVWQLDRIDANAFDSRTRHSELTMGQVEAEEPSNPTRKSGGEETDYALLPRWIQRYAAWHRVKKNEFFGSANKTSDAKFLVLVCQDGKDSPSNYFWMPPPGGLDWALPSSLPDRLWSCVRRDDTGGLLDVHSETRRREIRTALSADRRVICVATQEDLNKEAIRANFYSDRNETAPTDTFSRIYRLLFEPTPELRRFVLDSMEGLGLSPESPYLAAHVRSGYPLFNVSWFVWPDMDSHPDLVKSWSENAVRSVVAAYRQSLESNASSSFGDTDRLVVYVASDAPQVVEYLKSISDQAGNAAVANSREGWPLIVGMETKDRPNIDLAKPMHPSEWYPAFLDIWILSHARCVSYGIGGFGRFGANLARTGCMVQHRSSRKWLDYGLQHYGTRNTLLDENEFESKQDDVNKRIPELRPTRYGPVAQEKRSDNGKAHFRASTSLDVKSDALVVANQTGFYMVDGGMDFARQYLLWAVEKHPSGSQRPNTALSPPPLQSMLIVQLKSAKIRDNTAPESRFSRISSWPESIPGYSYDLAVLLLSQTLAASR